jgi:hypothetical protein
MKTYFTLTTAAIAAATFGFAAPAAAKIVSADFSVSLDLPDLVNPPSMGPRQFEALGATLGAGDELDVTNEIANPSNFRGGVNIDMTDTGLISITGFQENPGPFADYDLATFTISNIVFDNNDTVNGFFSYTEGLLDTNWRVGEVAPEITFGTDSITIVFDTTGSGSVSDFQFAQDGVSTLQLNLGEVTVVPLPAGLPLLLVGLGAMGVLRSRRKSDA